MLNNAMSVVILAAGKGTRMYSDLPKVLHTLAGKAMVQHVIDAANELGAAHVHLVYGHGGDLLKQALKDDNLNWVLQAEQLGTGHAMQQAAPFFADDEDILMLYGDVPLISVETLQRLRDAKPQGGIGLLTVKLDDPTGYGRITRENGKVTGIVEHKDATDELRQIQEINTGILIANGADMKRWLAELEEMVRLCGFYHTKAKDIIGMSQMLLEQYNGILPDTVEELTKLPGIGRKTANLIVGDIYHKPAIVCDTHCIRITNLLGLTTGKDPAKVEDQLRKILPPEESNDFCHRTVLFGREYCKARAPRCEECPISAACKHYADTHKSPRSDA